MVHFDRRTLVKGAAAGAALGGSLLDFATRIRAGKPVEAGNGRDAQRAALEALRAGRGRRVHEDGRRLLEGDERQGQRLQREFRRHPAKGVGRRQHGAGARPRVGPILAAAAVPREVHQGERRRRLSRQEIRRLAALAGGLRQVQERLDRHSGRGQRRPTELPHLADEEGGLQDVPDRLPGVPRTVPRR